MKMNDDRSGLNAVELILLVLLFSAGFLVGHFVAIKTGKIILGLVTGFLTCWGIAFLYSITIGRIPTKHQSTQTIDETKKENTKPSP